MNKKPIGSILMILGTAVGAGMLALPVVTAHETFIMSLVLLIGAWCLMTLGAFCLMEVNLWLPEKTNMISMAEKTLGHFGKYLTWCIYLLLLYSLICAYLAGLSDILHSLLSLAHINLPRALTTFASLILFGVIVYRGIGSVDLVNRGLMSMKLLAYAILVILVAKQIHFHYVFTGDFQWHNDAFMVMLTAFGYAIILPSLRVYLQNNQKTLMKVMFFGSLLPLIIYALWIFVVQGLIAKTGSDGLIAMLKTSNTNAMLMQSISEHLNTAWMGDLAKLFISICAITSFLGVSISLTDFVADGIKVRNKGKSRLVVFAITYLPPLCIVLIEPGIFIKALSYAGIWCLILLVIMPLSMLYVGRYVKKIATVRVIPLPKFLLVILLLLALILLGVNVWQVIPSF